MRFDRFAATRPAPTSPAEQRTHLLEARCVELAEAHGVVIDVKKADWPGVLDRLTGYSDDDWRTLFARGADVLIPAPTDDAPADDEPR